MVAQPLTTSREKAEYEDVLEFSALIEVTLFSLSQIHHRRRFNSCRYKVLSSPYEHASP